MSLTETHHFQAEIQQLLNIVINSLYTDKEIFIRELISNAADALEKFRFLQTSGHLIYQPELPLKISVLTDDKANTITVTDTGIGMTHGEIIENLGTIAHSGSKAFLNQLAEDKKPDASLIGQFGVGFYSAFMVAKKVTVSSHSIQPDQPGWCWISEGAGTYEMESADNLPRGTKVLLQLNDENKEFAQAIRVERVIKHFSNLYRFPQCKL
jgi:molecular chaperone HtpG